MAKYEREIDYPGDYKIHGITVELYSVSICYDPSDPYDAQVIDAQFKRASGIVDLNPALIDMINNENSDRIQAAALEDASDRWGMEDDFRKMRRDYWKDQLSRSDLESIR